MIVDLEEEIWSWVVGYEGLYQVSNMGRIKAVKRQTLSVHKRIYNLSEKLRKQTDAGQGYLVVHLSKNGVAESCRVNILVAKAFHPNPNNYPQVLHLNDIKNDNRAINLKWGTAYDNTIHRFKVFGYKTPKGADSNKSMPIEVIHPDGKREIIKGQKVAADMHGLSHHCISKVLKKKTKQHKGFVFKYIDKNKEIA